MISQHTIFALLVLLAVVYCRPDVNTNAIVGHKKSVDKTKTEEIKNEISNAINNNKSKTTIEKEETAPVEEEKKADEEANEKSEEKINESPKTDLSHGCHCAVFMSGQIPKGNQSPPKGNPVLMQEQDGLFSCTTLGIKQCTNKCLEAIVRHIPNSPTILCGMMEGDCRKERAYLFVQNCNSGWKNTKLSAGREYCCKDGHPYTCPLL